ncbi:homeobox-leucine zipper protein HDG8-like, partial [Cicer arietinum]
MDASTGGSSGSGDKKNNNQNSKKEVPFYQLTSHQEQKLQALFKSFPHPEEFHYHKFAKELGIKPEQVKQWFQIRTELTKICPPKSQTDHAPTASNKRKLEETRVVNKESDIKKHEEPGHSSDKNSEENDQNPNPTGGNGESQESQKARMLTVATVAMNELCCLISTDRPLWLKPLNEAHGVVLNPDMYVNLNPEIVQLLASGKREESSKEELIVRSSGKQLVDSILDSDKRIELFPTIVTNAITVTVLDTGAPETRSGALQLMFEEVHILSPIVPSRIFFFLRYCKKVANASWVIVDVSLDFFYDRQTPNSAHKLPSGCMITELPNGKSKVVWIEHVIVKDRRQPIKLYENLIRRCNPFGAKRWLHELQRMYEKNHFSSLEYIPRHANDKEIVSKETRKSVMNLSNRMVHNFCRDLNTCGSGHIPMQLFGNISNSDEIQFNHRKFKDGILFTATGSVRLHVAPETVFYFLSDETRRHEWDIVVEDSRMHEIAHISSSQNFSYNRVSIHETYNFDNERMIHIVQESCMDPVGAYVVFASVDTRKMYRILNGENSSTIPLFPSGFMISRDGQFDHFDTPGSHHTQKGTLLTFSYQVL